MNLLKRIEADHIKGHLELKTTDNPTVYNRRLREQLSCSYCRPNRGENGGRNPSKAKKPRRKDHRG